MGFQGITEHWLPARNLPSFSSFCCVFFFLSITLAIDRMCTAQPLYPLWSFGIWHLVSNPSRQAGRHLGSVQHKNYSLVSFNLSFPFSERERGFYIPWPATTWLDSDLYKLSHTLGFHMYVVFYLQLLCNFLGEV